MLITKWDRCHLLQGSGSITEEKGEKNVRAREWGDRLQKYIFWT